MSEELVTEIPNMKFESAMLQNFPNIKFSTGFAEEVQKLLVGEDVDVFIQNIDNLIESSKE